MPEGSDEGAKSSTFNNKCRASEPQREEKRPAVRFCLPCLSLSLKAFIAAIDPLDRLLMLCMTALHPKIPIKFLFLSPPANLEPLCASAAYWRARCRPSPKPESKNGASIRAAPFVLSGANHNPESRSMMDIILLGTVAVFFGLCFAYTQACDRL